MVCISICKSGILIPNLFLEFVKLNGWEFIPKYAEVICVEEDKRLALIRALLFRHDLSPNSLLKGLRFQHGW